MMADEIAMNIKAENMREKIASRFNGKDKQQFIDAIAMYDYLENDGTIWRTFDELMLDCYQTKVSKELQLALAEYITQFDKIFWGNQLLWNNNASNLCESELKKNN